MIGSSRGLRRISHLLKTGRPLGFDFAPRRRIQIGIGAVSDLFQTEFIDSTGRPLRMSNSIIEDGLVVGRLLMIGKDPG